MHLTGHEILPADLRVAADFIVLSIPRRRTLP
jgi:hypothetical protein